MKTTHKISIATLTIAVAIVACALAQPSAYAVKAGDAGCCYQKGTETDACPGGRRGSSVDCDKLSLTAQPGTDATEYWNCDKTTAKASESKQVCTSDSNTSVAGNQNGGQKDNKCPSASVYNECYLDKIVNMPSVWRVTVKKGPKACDAYKTYDGTGSCAHSIPGKQ